MYFISRKVERNLNSKTEANSSVKETFVPPIYNFVSSNLNPITWGEFSVLNKKYGRQIPSVKAVSSPN